MKNSKLDTIELAQAYANKGKPDDWFEEFYTRAEGDFKKIYWADMEPGPLLIRWLEEHSAPKGLRAITIGCGLGDDAEALALHGYDVTAFDISPSAIEMCRKRYPDSPVKYLTADLFDYPEYWHQGFELVYECNTIQVLTGENRLRAVRAIADLVAPRGAVLVSCRSRETGKNLDDFPLALDRQEIDGFRRSGLLEAALVAYDDNQQPPVPHFFGYYLR